MLNRRWYLLAALVLAGMAAGCATKQAREATPAPAAETPAAGAPAADPQEEHTWRDGVWQPPPGLEQLPLWPTGAPDMADVPQPGERVEVAETPNAIGGHTSEAVWDVSAPTVTLFPPTGRHSDAAVVVFPGGGFKAVVITLEGTEICDWITSRGMTCALVKYRVPDSNHHHDPACDCGVTPDVPRALQDAQRAIRLVRSRAGDLNGDPDKIRVMGFSAGGYLVAQTSTIFEQAYTPVDSVDRVSSRPDFALAFYPGHLCRPGNVLDPSIHSTDQAPPTFLLQAWDDPVDDVCNSTLYARALGEAGVPAEVHLFAKGGHGFGLRRREHPIAWPALVENWLAEIGVL